MKAWTVGVATCTACLVAIALWAKPHPASSPAWNPRAAAAYLDGRLAWWLQWPHAARDHETACVSCHTAVPYALARPSLHAALGDAWLAAPEGILHAHVVKRVRLWKDVEPFYPDQTRGLPRTSESRGTEAILNALILASRDAQAGTLTDDARRAFANLWPLQFKAGDLSGAWAWLNFHLEPWESSDAPYYGAALAALAVGSAPSGYSSSPEIQDQLTLLRQYLQRGADKESLLNRVMVLWASAKLPGLLTPAQRQAIIDAAVSLQRPDGGWALSALGTWRRADGTAIETASDGYATGLIALVLQRSGASRADPRVRDGLSWLAQHQDAASGMWRASSLNKARDPSTDIGKFMSDAATAYAALALTDVR